MRRLSTAAIVAVALLCATGAGSAAAAGTPVGMAERIPTKCGVQSLAAGADGNVWFTCFDARPIAGGTARVGRVTPDGKVSEFSGAFPANDEPGDIVLGPDGNLWFPLATGLDVDLSPKGRHGPAIASVTPEGKVTVFRAGLDPRYGVGEFTAGPDGNVWFTVGGTGTEAVGKITPTGQITEFPVAVGKGTISGLTLGPDGNLWFVKGSTDALEEGAAGVLVRLAPDGAMTEFGVGVAGFLPSDPVAGPDGNIWFLQHAKPRGIDRITPAGELSSFTAGFDHLSDSRSLISGPGGDLWFASQYPPAIARVTTAGATDEFSNCLRYTQPFFGPETLIAGPDGNVWFTSLATRSLPGITDPPSIGRITPDGAITQIYAGVDTEPHWIAPGPDGRVYFSGGANEIQRIAPFTEPVNTFRVLHAERASSAGAASVPVIVAGAGRLTMKPVALLLPHHRKVAMSGGATSVHPGGCGTPKVRVRATGPALLRFRANRRVTERFEVTFAPTGGTPHSELVSVVLNAPPRPR